MKQTRYTQFQRLYYLAEALRGLRYGLTVAAIRDELSDRMGQRWCERTIYRDLQSLDELALAERADDGRWCWIADGGLLDQKPAPLPPPVVSGQPGLVIFDCVDMSTGEVHHNLGRLFELTGGDDRTFFETAQLLYGNVDYWLSTNTIPVPRLVRRCGKAVHA